MGLLIALTVLLVVCTRFAGEAHMGQLGLGGTSKWFEDVTDEEYAGKRT